MQTQQQPETAIFNDFGGQLTKFKTTDMVDKRSTRWLFYPLQVIAASRQAELRRFRFGGDELELTTNVLYRGFLPKCGFTPLTMAPDFQPPDWVRENVETLEVDVPADTTEAWKGIPMGVSYSGSNLVGVARYPNDDMNTVITLNNDRGSLRGIREITALRKLDFDPTLSPELQRFFFPNFFGEFEGPRVPVALREVEVLTRDAIARARSGAEVGDFRLVDIGGEMLEACDQARGWANLKVMQDHAMMQVGGSNGDKTDGYSDLVIELLPQLEMQRQDAHLQTQKEQTATNTATLGELTAVMKSFITMQLAERVGERAADVGSAAISQSDVNEMVREAVQVALAGQSVLTAPKVDADRIDLRTKEGRELKARLEADKVSE